MPQTVGTGPTVRPADAADSAAISRIYNYYILSTVATFEEEAVTAEEIGRRIDAIRSAELPWLVAGDPTAGLVGYAYAAPWKPRSAYRYSVEITVYLAPECSGRGLGTLLYDVLFARLKERSIHAVVGGIALPNPASVALHEKFGLQQVALFKEQGFKFGRWVDVGYWQRLL
ncbi:MAG TPA: GNAT family N-acetyltransferase [Gemmatimonadales bacterium]|nr:GNAT family N-acetyltransferase [Gemmatimonadales bacterium]